ncbi:glycosyltransferase [Halalkalibacillus halophilus]|uniref:glycosyltransferase n=1 Tax=Halalkalibacillus halophilus TaxID=392827 RepID=UPI00040DE141|nr:glycosyltransferase [Halalkalibacillus halophilus]
MDKKIKVVFFIYYLGSGGAGRTFLNILNNIDQERFEPVLVTCNFEGTYEPYLNENIRFIKLKSSRLRKAIIPLAKILRKEKADIVFSTIPNYNMIAIFAKLLSFSKAKIIVREAAYLGGTKKSDRTLKIYGLFYRFSSKIIALSEGVKQNLIHKYGADQAKVSVIYNPIDLDHIKKQSRKEELPEPYQFLLDSKKKKIVTAGRMVDDKDHQTLLNAFQRVQRELDTELIIMGEGPLREKLIEQSRALDIEDRVHFIGFQQNPYTFFRLADVFVLTSKKEGFGHVIAEALATGTPVVTTDAKPGAAEVLMQGEYGRIVEIGDVESLAEQLTIILTTDPQEIEAIREKGLQRVEDFEAKTIVKQYENVFDEVANM